MQPSAGVDVIERVEALDTGLFEPIPSQTTPGCRRSLLAVQRVTADRHGSYAYLEIGSHLGGSIQPHLLDRRCEKIYSIDPRPASQPDDRKPGCRERYENNSTQRMLDLLEPVAPDQMSKIECLEEDASQVDPGLIAVRPRIVFIDGEHTKKAVWSDFRFCRRVVDRDATILFHDVGIIWPAIREICLALDSEGCPYRPLKLEGDVFAIFLQPEKIDSDSYLRPLQSRHGRSMLLLRLRHWGKRR